MRYEIGKQYCVWCHIPRVEESGHWVVGTLIEMYGPENGWAKLDTGNGGTITVPDYCGLAPMDEPLPTPSGISPNKAICETGD